MAFRWEQSAQMDRGSHVTIPHDALDLTVQALLVPPDMGPPGVAPASDMGHWDTPALVLLPVTDIWWSRLDK